MESAQINWLIFENYLNEAQRRTGLSLVSKLRRNLTQLYDRSYKSQMLCKQRTRNKL